MPRRLHYFAQPVWRAGATRSQRYEFRSAVDAEEGGRILARSADGVLVYRQWIDAEIDLFEDPEVLSILGDVPHTLLAIDPDAADPWTNAA